MAGRFRERIDMAVFGPVPEFVRLSIRLRLADPGPARGTGAAAALLARVRPAVRPAALAGWREAYAAVGLGPDVVPPPEALGAWAATPGGVPSTGRLADVVNAFALQHGVPAAAYDLGPRSGDLWLRPARGIEHFVPMGGGPPEVPPLGELVLVDSADRVLARDWHGAASRPFLVGPASRDVLVHLDLLTPAAPEPSRLADAFTRLALGFLDGHADTRTLSRTQPMVAWGGG